MLTMPRFRLTLVAVLLLLPMATLGKKKDGSKKRRSGKGAPADTPDKIGTPLRFDAEGLRKVESSARGTATERSKSPVPGTIEHVVKLDPSDRASCASCADLDQLWAAAAGTFADKVWTGSCDDHPTLCEEWRDGEMFSPVFAAWNGYKWIPFRGEKSTPALIKFVQQHLTPGGSIHEEEKELRAKIKESEEAATKWLNETRGSWPPLQHEMIPTGEWYSSIDRVREYLDEAATIGPLVVENPFNPAFASELSRCLYALPEHVWTLYMSTSEGFQYHHHNIHIEPDLFETHCPAYKRAVRWWEKDGAEWLRKVTGLKGDVAVSASWYKPGDYSTLHNDSPQTRRFLSFVWNLSPNWDERFGGDFVWSMPYMRYAPHPNKLYMYKVHKLSLHQVQPVWRHFNNTKRLAVNGWFVLDDEVPEKEREKLEKSALRFYGPNAKAA